MARPLVGVEIGNSKSNAIPNTSFRRSYIRAELTERFLKKPVEPFEVMLGSKKLSFKTVRK